MQPQLAGQLADKPSPEEYITMSEVIERFLRPNYGHDWAGYPTVMAGYGMQIHSSYPFAEKYREAFPSPEGVVAKPDITNPFGKLLDQMMVSPAWSMRAEIRALRKLRSHVNVHQFHSYFTTGGFLDVSQRSGTGYIFRRLRPTLAISLREDHTKFLAALCMHPIGFYDGTHAGAMVPTDDVLAHWMLMRADEHYFWRVSNQHSWKDKDLWY